MEDNPMAKTRFHYQCEKLSQARSALMAPHPMGEERSFAQAFDYCGRAFHNFDVALVDENARGWIKTIRHYMDRGEGSWADRARAMTIEEKDELSKAIDELASWFNREFWSR